MKKTTKRIIVGLVIVLFFFSGSLFAQNKKFTTIDWYEKLSGILSKQLTEYYVSKDTVYASAFQIKLTIIKTKPNQTKVLHFEVSDNSLYKMIPNYKVLFKINYSSLLGKRKKIEVLIPFVMLVNMSDNTNTQSFLSAQQVANKLLNATHLIRERKKRNLNKIFLDNVLLFNSFLITTTKGVACGKGSNQGIKKDIKINLIDSLKTNELK